MTNLRINQEKNTSPVFKKIPKWLQGPVDSGRRELEIDSLEEDGTAKNTAHVRPSLKWRTSKKVTRQIAEAEELNEWIQKKGEKELETGETKVDNFIDGLEKTLNDMVE